MQVIWFDFPRLGLLFLYLSVFVSKLPSVLLFKDAFVIHLSVNSLPSCLLRVSADMFPWEVITSLT